ncbi:MAG: hypothetical protein JXA07_03680 [Spirochaetes bacterium]|nr:hypothetical protein [Spirochaetota bacterium]
MKIVYRAAARKNVCISAFAATAVLTLFLWKIDALLAGAGGRGYIHLQLAFTRGTFENILSFWRSGSVDVLKTIQWVYFLYSASCAVLFSSSIAFFTQLRRGGGEQITVADLVIFSLPIAGMITGWAAQIMIVMIFNGAALSAPLIMAESIAAALSWAIFVISLIFLLRSYFLFRKEQKRSAGR